MLLVDTSNRQTLPAMTAPPMTVKIEKTSNGMAIRASGISITPQRVEIVAGSIYEGKIELGDGSTLSGVVLTVRPA